MAEVRAVVHLPVAADFNVSVAHGERVTGKELPNSLEESLALQAELEAQVVLERLGIRLDLRQKRNERLDLAGEIEDSIHLGVIKRLDPESIACTEERLLRLDPDGEGKHSPEVLDAIGAPLLVCTQRHLCVGCGPKPGITQFRAEFDVVVDLTVVRDPVTRLVPHRLVSGGKVDDRQTAVRKADRAPAMRPRGMPIRSPVGLDLVHELQPLREARYRPPRQVDDPGYATHDSGHPSQSRFHSAENRDDPLRRMAVPVQGRTRGFLRWQLQCCSSDPLGVGAAQAIPSKFKRLCPFRLVTQRQAWDAEVVRLLLDAAGVGEDDGCRSLEREHLEVAYRLPKSNRIRGGETELGNHLLCPRVERKDHRQPESPQDGGRTARREWRRSASIMMSPTTCTPPVMPSAASWSAAPCDGAKSQVATGSATK